MKKTILFFSEAVTVAHVVRLYKLASSLDKNIYDVHFAVADRYNYVFTQNDITLHRIKSIEHEEFIRRVECAEPMYQLEELVDYVIADKDIITQVKPDLVVGDLRQSLCVSTRLTGTTYVAMGNAYWSTYINQKKFPIPELRQINMNAIPLISTLIPLYFYLFFKNQGRALNALRHHFDLPKFDHCLDGWNFGDHIIYSDPEILFDTSVLPSTHHFIGSVNWEPDVETPSWWQNLSVAKKTAYVALGSSGDKTFIPSVVEKLLEEGFQVIVSGINDTDKKFVQDHESVFSAPLVSGSAAAARSELVISNGGSPTSYQSLLSGTPVIGIPTNLDQLLSMTFIEKNGLGKILRPRELGTSKHTKILKSMLESTYKEKARAVGKSLSNVYPEKNFAQVLSALLAK